MSSLLQPTLFDTKEITAANQKRSEEKKAAERAEFYQSAEIPNFENPQTDNEKLISLQYQYLKNNDTSAEKEFFLLAYKVMKQILWSEMKKKKLPYLNKEQQEETVNNAFEYVFRRYKKDKGYIVQKNFISVLKCGIRHALQYTRMADAEESLDSYKNDPTFRITRIF